MDGHGRLGCRQGGRRRRRHHHRHLRSGRGPEGAGAGLLSTSQQLGAACGLGVVAAVVAARTTTLDRGSVGSQAPVEALQWGLLTGVAFVALALAIVLAGLRRRGQSQDTAT